MAPVVVLQAELGEESEVELEEQDSEQALELDLVEMLVETEDTMLDSMEVMDVPVA